MTPKPPTLDAMLADPSIHDWVKDTARLLMTKDPIDSALGLALLSRVFESRTRDALAGAADLITKLAPKGPTLPTAMNEPAYREDPYNVKYCTMKNHEDIACLQESCDNCPIAR